MNFMNASGMANITSHSLEAAHAYKVVQFKSRLRNAAEAFGKTQQSFLKEVGIEDPEKFDRRRQELAERARRKELAEKANRTKEENELFDKLNEKLKGQKNLTKAEEEELKGMDEKLKRYNDLSEALMNEDAEIEPKTMPYEQWKALQDENRELKVQGVELLTLCEADLEGILWKAPEE